MTGAGPLHATLFWRNGRIEADVSVPRALECFGETVEIYGFDMTEQETDPLPRAQLAELFDLPLPYDAHILSATPLNQGGVTVVTRLGRRLFRHDGGQIWSAQPTSADAS